MGGRTRLIQLAILGKEIKQREVVGGKKGVVLLERLAKNKKAIFSPA